jgi:hypothetical protein
MITNQNAEIGNNSACLNKSCVRVGFIPVAALLLIILSTVNLLTIIYSGQAGVIRKIAHHHLR